MLAYWIFQRIVSKYSLCEIILFCIVLCVNSYSDDLTRTLQYNMTNCKGMDPASQADSSTSCTHKAKFWSTKAHGAYIPDSSQGGTAGEEVVEDAGKTVQSNILIGEQDEESLSGSDKEGSPEKASGEPVYSACQRKHLVINSEPLWNQIVSFFTSLKWC